MEWTKRICHDTNGDVIADPGEFFYDIGKRLVLGKEEGMEVNKNTKRGIECLIRAAELGHDASIWDLRCFVGSNSDLRIDFTKAAREYEIYVRQGNPMAASNLGVCYHKGRGVKQDLAKAVELYSMAALRGYPRALYNLAVCYDLGEGVKADLQKAVELYGQSAKGGYAVAQYYIGVCYLNGKGVTKDVPKAIEMWTRAANQGHAFAQYSLAQAYRDGHGVERDILKASYYFVEFTRWGDESGWECLKALFSKQLEIPSPYMPAMDRRASESNLMHMITSRRSLLGGYTSAPPSPQVSPYSQSSTQPSSTPPVLIHFHYFAERKQEKFQDHFHVPNLFDLTCMYFHKEWTNSMLRKTASNTLMIDSYNDFVDEDLIPPEVRHRIKYENIYCCKPNCQNYFFGEGRVQRRFVLRKEAGGTEAEEDDVVLHFCSLECARFDPGLGVASCKEFNPQQQQQQQ